MAHVKAERDVLAVSKTPWVPFALTKAGATILLLPRQRSSIPYNGVFACMIFGLFDREEI